MEQQVKDILLQQLQLLQQGCEKVEDLNSIAYASDAMLKIGVVLLDATE